MPRALQFAGAHPRWTALLLGAASALGFEPFALWPLTLLGMAGLIALIAAAPSRRQAAQLGWLFGLGQFSLGLNWIATAFTYQAAMPAWLGWVAVVGLSLYLAVYPALAAAAAWQARRRAAALVLALAGAWILAEWLRGWVFTGFPWNPLGVALLGPFETPGAARLAPWLGTYALSGLAVLFAGLWWHGLATFRQDRRRLALLALPLLAQFWPQAAPPATSPIRAPIPFALVQPDIAQDVLNDPAMYEANFQRTARLSGQIVPGRGQLVLWPESGVPWYLADGYPEQYYLDTYAADPRLARQRIERRVLDPVLRRRDGQPLWLAAGGFPGWSEGLLPGLRALLLPAPGEQHSFGLVMVSEFFRREGWYVTAAQPLRVQDALGLVSGNWIDLVALSVSSDRHLVTLADWVTQMRQASTNPDLKIMVGGPMACVDPQCLSPMQADVLGKDALHALDWAKTHVLSQLALTQ